MRTCFVFGLALLCLTSCNGDSQCELRLERLQEMRDQGWVVIDPGYLTGSEYLQLDEQSQRHYLDGVIDGMRLAPFLGAYDQTYPESRLRSLIYCVTTWGSERKTIVDAFIPAHPEQLKDSAHGLIFAALMGACNDLIQNCQDTTCQGLSTL